MCLSRERLDSDIFLKQAILAPICAYFDVAVSSVDASQHQNSKNCLWLGVAVQARWHLRNAPPAVTFRTVCVFSHGAVYVFCVTAALSSVQLLGLCNSDELCSL